MAYRMVVVDREELLTMWWMKTYLLVSALLSSNCGAGDEGDAGVQVPFTLSSCTGESVRELTSVFLRGAEPRLRPAQEEAKKIANRSRSVENESFIFRSTVEGPGDL